MLGRERAGNGRKISTEGWDGGCIVDAYMNSTRCGKIRTTTPPIFSLDKLQKDGIEIEHMW
jgi:hypothetical protein